MVAKVTNYSAIIFDFECDVFKRKICRQLYLDKELCRIGASPRYGLTNKDIANVISTMSSGTESVPHFSMAGATNSHACPGDGIHGAKLRAWMDERERSLRTLRYLGTSFLYLFSD
jgi:hypothetical protein